MKKKDLALGRLNESRQFVQSLAGKIGKRAIKEKKTEIVLVRWGDCWRLERRLKRRRYI